MIIETENLDESEKFDDEIELRRLIRSIEVSKKHYLFFACCNQKPKQNQLISRIEETLQDKKIKVIDFNESINDLLAKLQSIIADEKYDAIFVQGLDKSIASNAKGKDNLLISALNISRDTFPKYLTCPIYLWLPEYAITKIARNAPDFYSVRSGIFYFSSTPDMIMSQISEHYSQDYTEVLGLSLGAKNKRLETLTELLSEYESLPNDKRDISAEIRLLDQLADIYRITGNYLKAVALTKKLLEISEKELGENHSYTANSYNNLGSLYESQGKYELAEEYCLKALEIYKKELGENHLYTATSYNNLGSHYYLQGKYELAEEYYLKALEISEKELGENHPHTATSYNNLGLINKSQGKYELAEEYYVKSLKISEKELGENHPDTATSYSNLGSLYRSQEKYELAEEYCLKALEIYEKELGENHPDTAASYNNLGLLYQSQGKYELAEEYCLKALEIYEKELGENHPDTAASYNNLGLLYQSQGKYSETKGLLEKALNICIKELGENHPHTITVKESLQSLEDEMQNKGK